MKTEKSRRILRELAAAVLCLALLAAALAFATRLLKPKRFDYGATWGQYLQEEPDSIDVLFFGSSRTYCNVAPGVIWSESGITSYVMAGPEQTMPVTYYYVEEALKTQHPKAVFVAVDSLSYRRYTSYSKVNIGYLPMGATRIEAALTDAEPENRFGILWPLALYHSRWSALTAEDWQVALHGYDTDPLAGYTYLDEYVDCTELQDWTPTGSDLARNVEYLQKLVDLCSAQQIQVVLFTSPWRGAYGDDLGERIHAAAEQIDGAVYVDFNDLTDAMELNAESDYYDFLHFNISGAAKFSAYLAGYMERELGLTATAGADAAVWDGRADYFNALLAQGLRPRETS